LVTIVEAVEVVGSGSCPVLEVDPVALHAQLNPGSAGYGPSQVATSASARRGGEDRPLE
jgi:hypothetical protein